MVAYKDYMNSCCHSKKILTFDVCIKKIENKGV